MAAGYYRWRRRWRRLRRRLRRLDGRTVAATALGGLMLAALAHAHTPSPPRPATTLPAQTAAPPAAVGTVALGQQLASRYGWGSGAQWDCLFALWQRESGWSATAANPQSGAYGIAQALGHGPTNQYPAGPANPPTSDPAAQIRWGLGYIGGRYGSPCAAWAHEQADGWY